ncbi:MAG TPA: hypothetical protein VJS44_04715 [Pyrinomonadaceae bacterium]|nr:hypothetical protein [Pyrinomonadaceae bacterium]
MPTPVYPVDPKKLKGHGVLTSDGAEDLPVLVRADGYIVTRWQFSIWEVIRLLFGAHLFIAQDTKYEPPQALSLELEIPDENQ